jgi:hypothetical protein
VYHGLSVVAQNLQEDEDGAGHASRSSGLLHPEASQARVSQFGLKTGGGVAQMVHVASSQRSRGVEAEDGRGKLEEACMFPKNTHGVIKKTIPDITTTARS